MRYIIRALTFMLIPIVVNGIINYLKRPNKAEHGKVYMPKFLALFGIIVSAIFLIPTVITAFSDEPFWVPILFLLLSSLGATLIIAFVNCRISYDQNGFIHKNFFGKKSKFSYNQVTAIKQNIHEKFLYVEKKRIMIDGLSIGGDDFLEFVKKKYSIMHDGNNLPQIYKAKHDIFNGNIHYPGLHLFGYITVSVLTISLLICSVYIAYFSTSTPSNSIEQSVRFVSCDIKDNQVFLSSTDDQIYRISYIDDQFNANIIQTLCEEKLEVTVFSKKFIPNDENGFYYVKAIVYDGHYFLSFEESNRLHRQEYTLLVIVAIALWLGWSAFSTFSIVVGRNPKKFSKRIIRLFFKNRYVKY